MLGYEADVAEFESLSGVLSVSRNNELLTLNFPSQVPERCAIPEVYCQRFRKKTIGMPKKRRFCCGIPDHDFLKRVELRGVIVTSPSQKYDFVARFFAPKYGIPEDSVTGSAYTQLVPYWSDKLGKK